ncbi:MAG: LTA synthase family protein, partial [Paramuribaculum sp.]|nr:LTA synthase family protein [Paramuribaculum sp.]
GGSRIPQLKFMTDADAESIRSSVHTPADSLKTLKRKNIMVITLESGSKFWLDSLNDVPQAHKLGVMPFLDSIASRSLVNTHLLATGKRSVEGISAIFGGFPTFGDMLYMSSPYNANTVDSFVSLLKNEGYASRFYFGANHGSYSIDSFLKAMGFDSVIDRDSFADDSHHDGLWGIYDHAMGEYAALNISELQQPFVAGWFTLHLHEPFSVPSYWQPAPYRHNKPGPMRSAEYTDMALHHFFEIARTQPWFNNTIFIITGDHGSRDFKNTPFDTGYIQPHVMFLVYTPDGSIAPRRVTDRVMSQIDIGPTILGLLDYPKTYFALGTDMADSRSPHYALGYFNDQYTVTGNKYLITLGSSLDAPDKVFDITADPLLLNPLSSFDRTEVSEMIHWAQAFLQDYSSRMNSDRLRL